MIIHNFYKAKLIYQISASIEEKKRLLLKSLIKNCKDLYMYEKNFKDLKILNAYESNLYNKIFNFISFSHTDYDIFDKIEKELQTIIDIDE